MSIPSKIFHLLDRLDIDQKEFASAIGTTDKVVSGWKTGRLRSYTKYLNEIIEYFELPAAYFMGQTPFDEWENVIKYPISVFQELRKFIPADYWDDTVSDRKVLLAWLDITMCYGITGEGELELIKWFYRNISKISIHKKHKELSERYEEAEVRIEFCEGTPLAKRIFPVLAEQSSEAINHFVNLFFAMDDKAQEEIVSRILERQNKKVSESGTEDHVYDPATGSGGFVTQALRTKDSTDDTLVLTAPNNEIVSDLSRKKQK